MRRFRAAVACLFALLLIGGPLAAEDFTGSEMQERELDCIYEGEEVPENQTPPDYDGGDCPGTEANETYTGYVWTNELTCNDGEEADLEAAKLYTSGDPGDAEGGVGICNDGDTAPIQGRVVLYGSADDGSGHAYADGTDANPEGSAQGWARLDAGTGGPEIRCGSGDGRQSAASPTDSDTQDNCG